MNRGAASWVPLVVATLVAVAACGGDGRPRAAARHDPGEVVAGSSVPVSIDDDHTGDAGVAATWPATTLPAAKGVRGRVGVATTVPAPAIATGATTTTSAGGGSGTTTSTAVPRAGDTVGGCPDARGCDRHALIGGRWRPDANGVVTIRYRIKPDGNVHSQLTPDQVIIAIRSAAQTWMDAVPSVRLVYEGTTTELPDQGNNVVGWGPKRGLGIASAQLAPYREAQTYTGFSITLSNTSGFSWRPCDPPNGKPCDNDDGLPPDLQGVLTHEWGHVLGLEHVQDEAASEVTMHSTAFNTRHYVTLGLGDILGARSLYPTDAPIPMLYRP